MIMKFIDGCRRDKSSVDEIEGFIIEHFQDEWWFDDISEALALFVPGGGEFYIGEDELVLRLRDLQNALYL